MELTDRLKGKTALVTGGGRGFGRATVRRLAAEGADVAVCYRSGKDEAEAACAEVEAMGRRSFMVQADVAQADQARAAVQATIEHWGGIDVLVNNAGIRHISPFAEQDPAEWQEIIDVNIWGTMSAAQEVLPSMIARGSGCIVNLSSQQAHLGWENFGVYAATKAFVLALTKSIAIEVGRYGVTVNAVCPGPIITDMNRANTPPEREASISAKVPLRRMGEPEDVAAAVAYLASADAKFVTGQCIDVNGGLVTA